MLVKYKLWLFRCGRCVLCNWKGSNRLVS